MVTLSLTAYPRRHRARPAVSPGLVRALRLAGPVLLSVVLLGLALPAVLHVDWASIGAALATTTPTVLLGLCALWLVGLWVHTVALSAAMPGLSHRRALLLNLSGSSVSNLVPLGGAAGTVANFAMSRSWGFTSAAFARWALVTNIWDTLAKLVLPLLALVWIGRSGAPGPGALNSAAAWAGAGLVVIGSATALLLSRDAVARRLGRGVDVVAVRLRRPCADEGGYAARAVDLRRDSAALITTTWGRLTIGKAAYAALQAVLLWACLAAVGAHPALSVVFAGFAVERVLSMLVLTPGATGFTEVGMAGALVAMGVGPVESAAGVLLYRAFTFGMEIPVGGLALLWWRARAGRVATAG